MEIELTQAPPQEVAIYVPYYKEPNRRQALPYAMSLYKAGELVGERRVEGSPPVSFVASWRPSNLPSDLTLCRVMFDGDTDMVYELTLENFKFMGYMIDVVNHLRDRQYADFSNRFYGELFRMNLAGSEGS